MTKVKMDAPSDWDRTQSKYYYNIESYSKDDTVYMKDTNDTEIPVFDCYNSKDAKKVANELNKLLKKNYNLIMELRFT